MVAAGSPPLVLRGLAFYNHQSTDAAVWVSSPNNSITVEACHFVDNPAPGLSVTAGSLHLSDSTFARNGGTDINGGAIQLQQVDATISRCLFLENKAQDGGALALGSSTCRISHSTFRGNSANASGGALFAEDSLVTFQNQTLLEDNMASDGSASIAVNGSALVTYVLPTPPGFWISQPLQCHAASASSDPRCAVPEHIDRIVWPITAYDGTLGTLPSRCPPGVIGSSLMDLSTQANQLCAGVCPQGRYCPAGTDEPIDCQRGRYCPRGTPSPIPCDPGRHNALHGQATASSCLLCDAGFSCGLGSALPEACPIGTYTEGPGSSRCAECPPGTTTINVSSVGLSSCVCKTFTYDRDPLSNSSDCRDCPQLSTDCNAVGPGVILERLPLIPGYWRSYERSEEPRQCYTEDFCVGGLGCDGESNLCDAVCAENHMGPYCELLSPANPLQRELSPYMLLPSN